MATGSHKHELAEAVAKHFAELAPPEDEDAAINGFLAAVRLKQMSQSQQQRMTKTFYLGYSRFLVSNDDLDFVNSLQ